MLRNSKLTTYNSQLITNMGLELSRLERPPDKREVGGSSPLKPTRQLSVVKEYLENWIKIADKEKSMFINS